MRPAGGVKRGKGRRQKKTRGKTQMKILRADAMFYVQIRNSVSLERSRFETSGLRCAKRPAVGNDGYTHPISLTTDLPSLTATNRLGRKAAMQSFKTCYGCNERNVNQSAKSSPILIVIQIGSSCRQGWRYR